jgi:hypothetical protein
MTDRQCIELPMVNLLTKTFWPCLRKDLFPITELRNKKSLYWEHSILVPEVLPVRICWRASHLYQSELLSKKYKF